MINLRYKIYLLITSLVKFYKIHIFTKKFNPCDQIRDTFPKISLGYPKPTIKISPCLSGGTGVFSDLKVDYFAYLSHYKQFTINLITLYWIN